MRISMSKQYWHSINFNSMKPSFTYPITRYPHLIPQLDVFTEHSYLALHFSVNHDERHHNDSTHLLLFRKFFKMACDVGSLQEILKCIRTCQVIKNRVIYAKCSMFLEHSKSACENVSCKDKFQGLRYFISSMANEFLKPTQ